MLNNLTGWHFLIILAIVLLIFGATRLPALARSLGQSANAFKAEMKQKDETPVATTTTTVPTETPVNTVVVESTPVDPIDKATKQ